VEFRVLGPLEVLDGQTPIGPLSPRQRALLIALLLHRGTVVPRERLIDDLWADSPPATGQGVLQNYVSQLRKALGAERIVTRGPGYALALAPEELDAARFEAGLAEARAARAAGTSGRAADLAQAALALWRGAPLADVASEAFAQPEIARLAELRLSAVELAAGCALEAGRHAELPPVLEASLAADPLRERLWWLLILALYRDGRQADALRAYQKARRLLTEELGIAPGPELRELEVAVLQQRPELDWRAAGTLPAGAPGRESLPLLGVARARPTRVVEPQPAMVGRIAEQAVLAEFLGGRGRAGVLVVTGEPGIGKSRLLEEARRRAEAAGTVVVAGRAYAAERGRPYGAWTDALRSAPLPALPEELRDDLAALLPDLSSRRGELPDRNRLYDAVTDLLSRLAGADIEHGLLVVLDDVQWLDEPSAELLHVAARALAGGGGLLLLSARPGELADNPACSEVLRSLRREGALAELSLGPLEPSAVRELVEAAHGGVDAERIVGTGSGNPLLVLEMARALTRGEQLPGGGVEALIGDRLATLHDTAAALVPWVAAFGRPLPPALLADLVGTGPIELLGPLDELERYSVLRAGPDGTYDLAHDVVRDVAYGAVSPPRRALLHARIATVLATVPDPDGTLAADTARHADAGAASAICASACAQAGSRCLRLLAYAEAEELIALGRRHAARLEPQQRIRAELALLRLLLHPGLRLRNPGALADEVAEMCSLAQREGAPADLSDALTLLARVHHLHWGDLPQARALMARAAEAIGRAERPEVEPLLESARCLAWLEMDMPRTKALFDNLSGVGPIAENSVNYQWGLGLVSIWAGDTATARSALARGAELSAREADHWAAFECTARLALLEAEAGRAEAAGLLAGELPALADRLGGGSEAAYAAAVGALAGLAAGAADAPAELAAAVAGLERADARTLVPAVLNAAAELDAAAGRPELAAERARVALEVALVVGRPPEAARAHAVLACLAATAGHAEDAESHAGQALAGDADRLPAHVRALVEAARRRLGPSREEAGQRWP
jgi:DNA-binding SARP family transcriptional activator